MKRKLAIIRENESDPCPFGLKIPFACKNVGQCIQKRAPLSAAGKDADEEDLENIARANNRVMLMDSVGEQCSYAGTVFDDKKIRSVECNYGSNAPGITNTGLAASPFYSRVFDNVAYDGLYSFPQGWYSDQNISRNEYYSLYSLQGSEKENSEKIKK